MISNDRWWEDAACATPKFKELAAKAGAWRNPSEVFFPITESDDGRTGKAATGIAKYRARQERFDQLARRTCGDCPVRRECLLEACQNDAEPPWGFSGALDPKQRVDLLEGAELVSRECPGCLVTLWGTKNLPPPKRCSGLCK